MRFSFPRVSLRSTQATWLGDFSGEKNDKAPWHSCQRGFAGIGVPTVRVGGRANFPVKSEVNVS